MTDFQPHENDGTVVNHTVANNDNKYPNTPAEELPVKEPVAKPVAKPIVKK